MSYDEQNKAMTIALAILNLSTRGLQVAIHWLATEPRPYTMEAMEWLRLLNSEAFVKSIHHHYESLRRAVLPHIQVALLALEDVRKRKLLRGHSMWDLLELLQEYGLWSEAEIVQQQVVEALESDNSAMPHDQVVDSAILARTHWEWGELSFAEELQSDVTARASRIHGEGAILTLQMQKLLADIYISQEHLSEAKELLLEILQNTGPYETFMTANLVMTIKQDLAWIASQERTSMYDLEEQEGLVDHATASLDLLDPFVINMRNVLAMHHLKHGQVDEAQYILEDVVANQSTLFSETHPNALIYKGNLANVYAKQGKLEDALQLSISVMEDWLTTLPKHPATSVSILDAFNIAALMGYSESSEEVELRETARQHIPADFSIEALRRGWAPHTLAWAAWRSDGTKLEPSMSITALLLMWTSSLGVALYIISSPALAWPIGQAIQAVWQLLLVCLFIHILNEGTYTSRGTQQQLSAELELPNSSYYFQRNVTSTLMLGNSSSTSLPTTQNNSRVLAYWQPCNGPNGRESPDEGSRWGFVVIVPFFFCFIYIMA